MAIPADQLPVGEGLLPDGGRYPFFISRSELDQLFRNGPEAKCDDLRFVAGTISDPDAIFAGLRRPNQTDSLCYSVRVTSDPDDGEDPYNLNLPVRPGEVFLVFACPGQMGYMVIDWEWREEDPDEPGHPRGHPDDFARRVWQRT